MPLKQLNNIFMSSYNSTILVFVGNPGLLYSHALDCVRCMQIYLRLFKSIIVDKKVLKNNMDTIENIDLENKATYL